VSEVNRTPSWKLHRQRQLLAVARQLVESDHRELLRCAVSRCCSWRHKHALAGMHYSVAQTACERDCAGPNKTARSVNLRPLIMDGRVRPQAIPCDICGGQSDIGTGSPISYVHSINGIPMSWDSSVGIATRYGLDGPGIESRWRLGIYIRPDVPWSPPSLV
jgi:hypothetical protein